MNKHCGGYKNCLIGILDSALNIIASTAFIINGKTVILRNGIENSDKSIVTCVYDYLNNDSKMGMIKLDSNLNILWANWYGDSLLCKSTGCTSFNSNGYVLSGFGEGFGLGDSNLLLIRCDTNGNTSQNCFTSPISILVYNYSFISNYSPPNSPNLSYGTFITANNNQALIEQSFCIPLLLPICNIASSDSVFCDKQAIDFYDLSTNNPTQWLWFFSGASPSISTMQNPVNIYYASRVA
ncbi:MAG: hypothetical protein IPP29_15840 [Bacteroidetes bacterium]|nr:hypothetical protein [Bacteroidota bacterium]